MVKIDPNSGYIIQKLDFHPLRLAERAIVKERGEDVNYDNFNNVCNGIAYDSEQDVFYVTGKRWHLMFKIRLLQ